ncbi:MAG: hypothetical protein WDN26_22135 [Chitinophagaceae bacterium]
MIICAWSTHEEVIAKLGFVTHRSGAGSSGTRNISGTRHFIKNWKQHWPNGIKKKRALLFNGAYQANVTTLQTLARHIPGLVFISDERNHASIIEGMRGCRNEKKIFGIMICRILKKYYKPFLLTSPSLSFLNLFTLSKELLHR